MKSFKEPPKDGYPLNRGGAKFNIFDNNTMIKFDSLCYRRKQCN